MEDSALIADTGARRWRGSAERRSNGVEGAAVVVLGDSRWARRRGTSGAAYRRSAKQLHPDRGGAGRPGGGSRAVHRASGGAWRGRCSPRRRSSRSRGKRAPGQCSRGGHIRPAGRQRGGPATGTGVAESDDRRSAALDALGGGLVAIGGLDSWGVCGCIGVKEMFSSGSMSEPPVPRVDVCDRNGMLRAAIEEGTGSGALGEAEGGQTNTEAPEAWPPPSALVPGGGHERPRSRGTDYHIPQEGESR